MRIPWSGPAVRDFTQICDYIGEHGSAATARRLALSIYERIGILTKFPEFGRAGRQPDTRELVLTGLPYLAVNRLRGDSIEILRLLHGAQDWPSSGSDQL